MTEIRGIVIGLANTNTIILPLYHTNQMFEFDCSNTADDMLKVTILDENDQSRGVAVFTLDAIFEHPNKLGFLEMSANRGA